MTTYSRKESKIIESLIENYFGNKVIAHETTSKNISESTLFPSIHSFKHLLGRHEYNLQQLKEFAKHYHLHVTGTKSQLAYRLYSFLYMTSSAMTIQKMFRGKLARIFNLLHGPAARNRELCTNKDDFISMEPLGEILFKQFISYKDIDGFIYGFDIASLHNLFIKEGKNARNPYNRSLFPTKVVTDTMKLIRLGKLLNVPLDLQFEDASETVDDKKAMELRALSLFQSIDSLGNYSNAEWFLSLNRVKTIKFVRDLVDIWTYRAQIQPQMKRHICPPFGDPFHNITNDSILSEEDLTILKTTVLHIIEKLVNTGIDKDSKALGAYYVLGALTLVNDDAATALPWLYQSMNYF